MLVSRALDHCSNETPPPPTPPSTKGDAFARAVAEADAAVAPHARSLEACAARRFARRRFLGDGAVPQAVNASGGWAGVRARRRCSRAPSSLYGRRARPRRGIERARGRPTTPSAGRPRRRSCACSARTRPCSARLRRAGELHAPAQTVAAHARDGERHEPLARRRQPALVVYDRSHRARAPRGVSDGRSFPASALVGGPRRARARQPRLRAARSAACPAAAGENRL